MSVDKALAMITDCNVTWEQLRKIKRYSAGQNIPSERKICKRQEELIDGVFMATTQKLMQRSTRTKGLSLTDSAVVWMTKIEDTIGAHLEQHFMLDNLVPFNNEIWLKFGGDQGEGSTKFEVQILNIKSPNATRNVIVVLLFEAPDCLYNIEATLPNVSCEISNMNGKKWRDYTLRMFGFGDYAYLTKLYGLLGPTGRYPCLFCTLTNREIHAGKTPDVA
ncbi:uncharacterized protein [Antedon mediterranea]|uniref:uncharacterized protein n=1 Tax=Antedon mediterranea TaxID=105859 RepID=UPI003AF60ED2